MVVVKEILSGFREAYIVIDAFDECEQNEKILRWIQELVESRYGKLHLLVSSRQDCCFHITLKSLTTSIIAIHEYTFGNNLQLYIRERLSTDSRMMRWPYSIQETIEQSLIANVGGLCVAFEF